MKKSFSFLIAISFLTIPFLSACGGGADALPNDSRSKVTFAFNGVERSMKAQQSGKRSLLNPRKAEPSQTAIDNLFSYMESQGQTESPEFPYDEPPMIQFQYVKALYEAVGDDFTFGTIYQDTVTGVVDFDFSTGNKGVSQDYVMNLRLDIDIDSNDLITVHCGMSTTYTDASSNVNKQDFYAEIELDYDMGKTSPTYTMGMRVVDDSISAGIITYEYDYVNINDNKFVEWRKATVETSERLTSSFDSYLNKEDFKFSVGASGYRNSTIYKATKTGYSNPEHQASRKGLASLVADQLGCNGNDIHYGEYFNKSVTQNSKITEVYNSFSRILGQDIAQSLPITAADAFADKPVDPQEDDNAIAYLDIFSSLTDQVIIRSGEPQFKVIVDCKISDLFTTDVVYDNPQLGHPVLGFADSSGKLISKTTVEEMTYIAVLNGDDGEVVTTDDYIASIAQQHEFGELSLGFFYVSEEGREFGTKIVFDVSALLNQNQPEPEKTSSSQQGSQQQEEAKVTSISVVGSSCGWDVNGGLEFERDTDETIFHIFFSASAEEEFKFVVNHSWDLPSYGYTEVNPDFEFITCGKENGNFHVEAACDIEVTATVISPEFVSFSMTASLIQGEDPIQDTVVNSITVVGSFNDWNVEDETIAFDYKNEYTFTKVFSLDAGIEFKFVINHTWELPSYGYKDIADVRSAGVSDVFAQGKDPVNILTLKGCLLSVTATIESVKSISFSVSVIQRF